MFVGRNTEMNILLNRIDSARFEFGILYGRRRIGKTALLWEVLRKRKGIYFVATEMDLNYNLGKLSEAIADYFKEPVSFSNLDNVFAYLKQKSITRRVVLIIDEFTYLFAKEKGVESIFQNIIDQNLKDANIALILSGSQVGMIEKVISYKRPLHGRTTFTLQLLPFNYYEAALFYPKFSALDKIRAYAIFGG